MSPPSPLLLSTEIDCVDWEALVALFERLQFGTQRDPPVVEQLFRNSGCYCFAYHSGALIGCGRALTDRINYALVLDVVVAPECQGKGYGSEIMRFLVSASGAKNHILHAVPDKQPFYAKLGFRKMKTAMALFADPKRWTDRGFIE
jgi:ribosomal protein S18 acetylase RimI-like enzyme